MSPSPTPSRKCPKCGGDMQTNRRLSCHTEITLVKEDEYVGDRIEVSYCRSCSYIELYRGEDISK